MRSLILPALLASALCGCATSGPAACGAGEQPAVSEMLYFGTARPAGGTVSAEEWAEFLRTTVTPSFPSGLTVWPASGQWRGNDGEVVREDSYVLNLLHAASAAEDRKVAAVIAAYRERFAQEAVLRVRSRACMSY